MVTQLAKGLLGKAFGKHLLVTNTIASTCLMGVGDILQQQIELRFGDSAKHDWKRTRRMMTMGIVLGPMVHSWYGFLDRYYKVTNWKTVLYKILCDQCFGAPTFSFVFITGMSLQQGKTVREGVHDFLAKFPAVYAADWLVWPPTQAINFYFIPPQLRAVYVYFVDVVWYTFNSFIVHQYHPVWHISVQSTTQAPSEEDVIDVEIVPIIR